MVKNTFLSALCVTAAMTLSSVVFAADHSAHAHGHKAEMKDSATEVVGTECWARLRAAPQASALYFKLENKDAKKAAHAVGITSKAFADLMLHESYEEKGMAGMRHIAEVVIAPASTVDFKPGGYHVMMEKPQKGLKVGDKMDVELQLSNGHAVPMNCVLKSISARSFQE